MIPSKRGRPRNDERARAMYDRYQEGLSLRMVAAAFGCTVNNVWLLFHTRGWPCRDRVRVAATK